MHKFLRTMTAAAVAAAMAPAYAADATYNVDVVVVGAGAAGTAAGWAVAEKGLKVAYSYISRLIRAKDTVRIRPELGTRPSLRYIPFVKKGA